MKNTITTSLTVVQQSLGSSLSGIRFAAVIRSYRLSRKVAPLTIKRQVVPSSGLILGKIR